MTMKKIFFTILLLLSVSAGFQAKDADTLRVMSYNLRFGELASMESFSSAISAIGPDIIALQECDWGTYREMAKQQNGVKFVNSLACGTGMFGLYGKAIDYKKGYYGIGILSKYPIIRSERLLLPKVGDSEQRVILAADIELPGGKVITFICTHLEVSSSEDRIKQIKFIEKYVKKLSAPIIIAGDFNAEPDSEEIGLMNKKWMDLTDKELTFSTQEPSIKIDYIYCRPKEKFILKSTEVKKDLKLSDHFPIVSDIIIRP